MDGIGNATLLVLPTSSGHLATDRLLLPGGGVADVFVDDDGDTLVQVGADLITSTQLVAAVLRSPALQVDGRVLDVAIVGEAGHDRLTLTADRGALLTQTRRWTDHPGPHVTVVRAGPTRSGDGAPADEDLVAAARLVERTLAEPSAVTIVHVDPGLDGPAPGTGDGGRRLQAMQDADLVVAAWGVVPGPPAAASGAVDAVVAELREVRDGGGRVLVVADDGVIRTTGRPAGPGAGLGATGATRLVPAPADWLWGGPLH